MSDTRSIATRDRLISDILRKKDDAFDTSDIAVVDRFPINTGFGIVTYELVGMAPPPGLAEPDLNFARYFLVFGGLIISQQSAVIRQNQIFSPMPWVLTISNLKSEI